MYFQINMMLLETFDGHSVSNSYLYVHTCVCSQDTQQNKIMILYIFFISLCLPFSSDFEMQYISMLCTFLTSYCVYIHTYLFLWTFPHSMINLNFRGWFLINVSADLHAINGSLSSLSCVCMCACVRERLDLILLQICYSVNVIGCLCPLDNVYQAETSLLAMATQCLIGLLMMTFLSYAPSLLH